GVDQARVNSAFTAAANDTINQAVRDGKLSESQAADARKMVEGGLSGFLLKTGLKTDNRDSKEDQAIDAAQTAAFNAAATTIGVSIDELMQGLKAGGKSITDLATEHKVDPQK